MAVTGISDTGAKLIGWGSIALPFTTIAIILRFIARRQHAILGPDDWLMLVAYVLYIGLYIALVVWAPIGKVGFTQSDLSLDQLNTFFKVFWAVQFFYGLVGPAIKISILLLYKRLFSPVKPFLWTCYIIGALVAIWCISVTFTVIFECLPVGSYWNVMEQRTCVDAQKFYWANGISNLLLDFIILVMPAPMIWRLHMSVQQKLQLTVVLSLGLFVCIASILRIAYLWTIQFDNVTGTIAIPSIWTSLEPGFGIVAGCLPALTAMFRSRSGRNNRSTQPTGSNISGSWFKTILPRKSHVSISSMSSSNPVISRGDGASSHANIRPSAKPNDVHELTQHGIIGVSREVSVTVHNSR